MTTATATARSTDDIVASLVIKATHESLTSEDWDTNVQICDLLMQRPDETSIPVINAIIRRLQNKNKSVQLLALTLLDSCVKNATDLFRRQLCAPKHMATIESLASTKSQQQAGHDDALLDMELSEIEVSPVSTRVKDMLQDWNREFGLRVPGFGVCLDRISDRPHGTSATAPAPTSPAATAAPSPSTAAAITTPLDPLQKIREDMIVAKNTVRSLAEMVRSAQSVSDIKADPRVLQTIVNCREMHRRLIRLIESVPEEKLLLDLIELNDELYAAIEEHDTFKRTGAKPTTTTAPPSAGAIQQQQQQQQQQQLQQPQAGVTSGAPLSLDDIFGMVPPAQPQPSAPQFVDTAQPSSSSSMAQQAPSTPQRPTTSTAADASPSSSSGLLPAPTSSSVGESPSSVAARRRQRAVESNKSSIKQPANVDDLLL